MRVLIVEWDLFRTTGGGQSVYRALIERNPDIEFYYLTTTDSSHHNRPANAHGIPYKSRYGASEFRVDLTDVSPLSWLFDDFARANNIAASVAGMQFDIVDLPDYEQCGALLRPALKHYQVRVGKIVLAMHGCISNTVRLNWATDEIRSVQMEDRENVQFRAADVRYAISQSYMDEWSARTQLPIEYLDPLHILGKVEPLRSRRSSDRPTLSFIGRTERRKGPDIFVDLTWWLPDHSYREAQIIGPESHDNSGRSSTSYLEAMIAMRGADIRLRGGMAKTDLHALFGSRTLVCLPSRYDTFNLLAMEALFAGCPVAVGSGAGVRRFLDERMPDVPYVRIDVGNVFACLPALSEALRNYDDYRDTVVAEMQRCELHPQGEGLIEAYQSSASADADVVAASEHWYQLLRGYWDEGAIKRPTRLVIRTATRVKAVLPARLRGRLRRVRDAREQGLLPRAFKAWLRRSRFRNSGRLVEQWGRAMRLHSKYNRFATESRELTESHLRQKLKMCWAISGSTQIDRARVWSEIARLERLRGNALTSATYDIRVMRALGEDRFGRLPAVINALNAVGLPTEAEACRALFGPQVQRPASAKALLDDALARNAHNPEPEFELVDDRRGGSSFRVAVIVSMYGAAAKLRYFLHTLSAQTLLQRRELEIILVDSGSPTDEYQVFKEFVRVTDLPAMYVRTKNRETIQAAWNRGIAVSRAPYLAFLGTDETVLPICLERLAAELDADQTLDWVQANSLVTNVAHDGSWLGDIMTYDRDGGRRESPYLETCYLSWVGALYRRSIHERIGYYDATFRAAGDTEFKNRVLPFIKTKYLRETLGVFLNYPDERTTQSPLAELEDVRAWYLHRSAAGVQYALSGMTPPAAEALLQDCLKYRKSYCRHWSSDIDYGVNLAQALVQHGDAQSPSRFLQELLMVQKIYRQLEWLPNTTPVSVSGTIVRAMRSLSQVQNKFKSVSSMVVPAFEVFNDNRYEQHQGVWKSES